MELVFKRELNSKKDKVVRQYAQLSSHRQDFIDALKIVDILKTEMIIGIDAVMNGPEQTQRLINALWKGFIVTYMKCFTQSNFRSVLSKRDVHTALVETNLINKHFQLSELRQKHIAHYDESSHSTLIVYGEIHQDPQNKRHIVYKINSEGLRTFYPAIEDLATYETICNLFIIYMEKQINPILDRIRNTYQPLHLAEFSPNVVYATTNQQ